MLRTARHRFAWLAVRRLLSHPILPYTGLVLLAFGLRLHGLDWGGFHPDEWAISAAVYRLAWPDSLGQLLSAESPLDPHWFNYGSLPLYAFRVISWVAAGVRGVVPALPSDVVLWRAASGIADVATLGLTILIGRTLYGPVVGFLGGLLYAVAVLPIQLSHFYAVDPLLTTFLTAAFLASILFVRTGSLRSGMAASAFMGLAVATKAAGGLFLWPVALAWLVVVLRRPGGAKNWRPWFAIGAAALSAGVAVAVFALGQPYALLDWSAFWRDVLQQARMVRGDIEFPYTIQYVQTTPYLFHLRNLVVWGLGAPLGLAALAGAGLLLWRTARHRRPLEALLVVALLAPLLLIGGQQVKFMRYLLPLYPLLAIVGALAIVEAGRFFARGPRRLRWAGTALLLVVVVPTALYAFAFANIYSKPHPVQRMGRWVEANVPPGAAIAVEAWDQGFPGIERFQTVQVSPYDPDNEAKVQRLATNLAEADYVFLFSNRAYGALSRLPERYPLMREYYHRLLSGGLGFQVARVETAYPSLLGVSLVDDTMEALGPGLPASLVAPAQTPWALMLGSADESFTVYDHPKAVLLMKTEELSVAELSSRLRPALAPPAPEALPPQLMMDPELAQAQRDGGTWSSIFSTSGPAVQLPVLVWLVAFQVIAFAGLPLAMRLFRPLPDRGYLLGKTLSLLLVAYLAWLLASLSLVPFSRESVLLGISALGLVSAYVAYRTRRELLHVLRTRWPVFLTGEVLFLAAFIGFTLLRAANPDLWHPFRGGEKPMDLAYLIAVTRSTFMPPYDPWFAGGYLNYYYFGQFLIATLIRLTGIVPEVAFNLAVPLLWALTLGGAFSIVYNLTEASRNARWRRRSMRGPVLAGLAGAALVGLAGNLDGALQVLQRVREGLRSVIASADGLGDIGLRTIDVVGAAVTGQGFDYWRSSRMVDVPGSISITEFPFFTFLFGDLHAHMMALPLTLLALGLALALAFAVASRRGFTSRVLPLIALALSLGALLATNAWDYPTYLLIGPVAVLIACLARGDRPLRAAASAGVILVTVLALSYGAFAPYHRDNISFYTQIVASPERTPVHSYLAIFGLPLFIVVSALVLSLWRLLATPTGGLRLLTEPTGAVALAASPEARRLWGALAVALGGIAIILPLVIAGYGVVAINALLIVGLGIVALAPGTPLPRRLGFASAALALLLVAGVDLFAVNDHLVRMNTIFRIYIQAWVLLGLAAGYLLWWLAGEGIFHGVPRSVLKSAFAVGLVSLVVAASLYPFLGTRARLADRIAILPLTLDGMAYMDAGVYRDVGNTEIELHWEREALEWLRTGVTGTPVVAEAVLPPPPYDIPYYRVLSRVAVYTGLPVVIGWPWHQTQQRGIGKADPLVKRREADVRALFNSGDMDRVRGVLRRYGIEYIYVGQLERAYYAPEGLAALVEMLELRVAYKNPRVVIYQVRR